MSAKSKRPICGARTRKGDPCQAPSLWEDVVERARNGRCRLHGGLSTGPRTVAGKARSMEALRSGNKLWRARLGQSQERRN